MTSRYSTVGNVPFSKAVHSYNMELQRRLTLVRPLHDSGILPVSSFAENNRVVNCIGQGMSIVTCHDTEQMYMIKQQIH